MQNRLQKWGNSLAVRIPKYIMEELNWDQNTRIRERIVDGKLVIEAVQGPVYTLEELLAGMTPKNMHDEVDTGQAVGKEIW